MAKQMKKLALRNINYISTVDASSSSCMSARRDR